jgi:hypothetical protein
VESPYDVHCMAVAKTRRNANSGAPYFYFILFYFIYLFYLFYFIYFILFILFYFQKGLLGDAFESLRDYSAGIFGAYIQ